MNIKSLKSKSRSYKAVFNSPDGERVLADLLNFCGQYKCSHNPGDANSTAFNEGKRRVSLRILKFIDMEEKEIQKILKATESPESTNINQDPFGLYK
jgi:hypothetical protein